ncbi:MAG: phenylacetate--CoA ligase family protein [Candidatus Aenigmarchaeota archaeon]|nr:phenylacetate--CoA ligase family protein [Candidatus Aenigmarchaeota archaeon]
MLARKLYYLKRVMKNQWAKKGDLEKLRNKMLRGLLMHAERNVPFYHDLWKKNDVDISKIKTVGDISKLPVITRKDVLENYKSMMAANYQRTHDVSKLTLRATSGTSGNPLEMIFDERANDYLEAVYLRGLMVAGYKPWKPLVYYWWKDFEKRAYNDFGFMNKVYVPCSLSEDEQLKILQSKNTGYVYYYGGILYSIAQKMLRFGIRIDAETVITHAEMITNQMRKRIADAFGVEPFDQYGTTEFNRLAWQCEKREDYHVDADSVIMELGGEGTDVITGLANYMLPMIRYDMGDVIETSDGCSCGRTLPTIKAVKGRKEDMIIMKSGKVFTPADIADAIAPIPDLFKFSVIYLGNSKFRADVVPFKGAKNIEDAVERALKSRLDEDAKIDVSVVDEIPKSKRGKRTFVSVDKDINTV